MSNYKIKINCVVLSTDIPLNKQYVLSLNNEDLVLPHLMLDQTILDNLVGSLIKYLKEFVFVNDLELLPQLINIHSPFIQSEDNTLNFVYGFVINHTLNINNAYWIPFNLMEEKPYSNLILEVIQKLQ